jgi:NADH:ubiquinone oxidoreductase subunit H
VKTAILEIVLIAAVVIGIVAFAVHASNKAQAVCERRGGVYYQLHGGWLCLDPKVLK